MIMIRWILPEMKKVSDEKCRENRETNSTPNTFLSEKSVIYEITAKNTAELCWP
jgi:hypothetical protein